MNPQKSIREIAVYKNGFGIALSALAMLALMVCGCDKKVEIYRVGVLQWTQNVEPFNQTYRGVLDGLADRGFREGINLALIFADADQDSEAALKIAGRFVEDGVDLIVALGTGSSLAALEATHKEAIPIVFSIVGAPLATGIIDSYSAPGRNITGVSMKVPVRDQFEMAKACLPSIQTIGVLYCLKMPQAVATGQEALKSASDFGWQAVKMSLTFQQLPRLETIVDRIAGSVDAIYIPTDPIMSAPQNLQRVIAVADKYRLPVITVAERFVAQDSLMALSCDFYDIGRQAAEQVEKVLAGVPVQTIAVQKPVITRLSLNLKKAKQLGITIKRNCVLKADRILD